MAMEKGQEMRNEGNHDPRTDLVTWETLRKAFIFSSWEAYTLVPF